MDSTITESSASSEEKKNDETSSPCKPSSHDDTEYELVGDSYYYSDKITGIKYKFNQETQEWENVESLDKEGAETNPNSVTTDKDGRQYYYAEGLYLCCDPQRNVFYMDENNEWKPWSEKTKTGKTEGVSNMKWHYHKDGESFYRDNSLNKVYKLNKESNEWELYEKKKKRKRKAINPDEEFDTDDDEQSVSEDEEEMNDSPFPPGFNSDPNIKFSENIYTKFDPLDNMTYEWDPTKKAWFPKIDDDFMATYQLSYGFNPDGTKNENPLKFDDDEEENEVEVKEDDKENSTDKKKPTWFEVDDAHNTKVYVSNLPTETTEEQLVEFMSKCGLLLKDPESQKYKIKMYLDSNKVFKGDALCTYIKIESVDLALQILDESKLGNNTVKVERATFTLKGDYDPKLKPKKRRKKVIDKLQKKQEKLFDWRPDPMRGQRQKHENVVILRNVFDPKEFETVAERILTHKEAIRNQATTFGSVKKLELFDRHPEGVVKIIFDEIEAADLCVATLHNRLYLKRRLVAATWDGSQKFNIEETEAQREERIQKWNEFLEGRTPDA